jgi:PPOX class probable F420-dependent enzyme
VNTPVWFGLNGTRLYVRTETPSGKIKRIRNGPHVQIAPCTILGRSLGAPMDARARILPPEEEALAERAYGESAGSISRSCPARRSLHPGTKRRNWEQKGNAEHVARQHSHLPVCGHDVPA